MREMRRKRQQLSEKETIEILEQGTSGVLALHGEEGYPYALPISYVYTDNKIYFHSARSGHKIDAILQNEKASFCVIHQDHVVAEEYTTYFKSAIAFGRVHIIEDEIKKRQAILELAKKYHPKGLEHEKTIDKEFHLLCMLEFDIEHLTGKVAKELIK